MHLSWQRPFRVPAAAAPEAPGPSRARGRQVLSLRGQLSSAASAGAAAEARARAAAGSAQARAEQLRALRDEHDAATTALRAVRQRSPHNGLQLWLRRLRLGAAQALSVWKGARPGGRRARSWRRCRRGSAATGARRWRRRRCWRRSWPRWAPSTETRSPRRAARAAPRPGLAYGSVLPVARCHAVRVRCACCTRAPTDVPRGTRRPLRPSVPLRQGP